MTNLKIANKLRTSGLRPTKQRIQIAEFLFERTKTLRQLRERKTYAKPCVSNRAARKKAIYVERMKSLSDAE